MAGTSGLLTGRLPSSTHWRFACFVSQFSAERFIVASRRGVYADAQKAGELGFAGAGVLWWGDDAQKAGEL